MQWTMTSVMGGIKEKRQTANTTGRGPRGRDGAVLSSHGKSDETDREMRVAILFLYRLSHRVDTFMGSLDMV